jgi:hypothetical protein
MKLPRFGAFMTIKTELPDFKTELPDFILVGKMRR